MTAASAGALARDEQRDAPWQWLAPEVLSKHVGSDPGKGLTAQVREQVKASATWWWIEYSTSMRSAHPTTSDLVSQHQLVRVGGKIVLAGEVGIGKSP
jgi:hypothetical protein